MLKNVKSPNKRFHVFIPILHIWPGGRTGGADGGGRTFPATG